MGCAFPRVRGRYPREMHLDAENGNSFSVATRDACLTGDLSLSQFLISSITINFVYLLCFFREEKNSVSKNIVSLMIQQTPREIFGRN